MLAFLSRNSAGKSASQHRQWQSGSSSRRGRSHTGYHASLDSAKLGVPMRVVVRLTIPGGELQISRTVSALKELSEISRCHRITGAESFVIEADVVSIRHSRGADRQALRPRCDFDLYRSVISRGAARPPGETDRVIREVHLMRANHAPLYRDSAGRRSCRRT